MPATEADRRVRRVLIVDDNRAIHDDFHRMLQNDGGDQSFDAVEALFLGEHSPAMTDGAGYEIADAYQGEEGVDAAAAAIDNGEPFDVAFVDMRMPPGWDGLTTIERLFAIDPEIAELVDDERDAFAVCGGKKVADQRRFTCTEKAGDHGCGNFLAVGHGHQSCPCRLMPAA